jgi:hypothetical protein
MVIATDPVLQASNDRIELRLEVLREIEDRVIKVSEIPTLVSEVDALDVLIDGINKGLEEKYLS